LIHFKLYFIRVPYFYRLREEDTPVRSIYNDAVRPLMDAGYEFVAEVPTYFDEVKNGFYGARKQFR